MFILDTDHISMFQRQHVQVASRILATPSQELSTTIITVEEQLRGRLDRVRRAQSDDEIVRAYQNLHVTLSYFRTITVIDFDREAQAIFRRLRTERIRIGTQDLRIAAIALSRSAILVTRNRRDFGAIASLSLEDWS